MTVVPQRQRGGRRGHDDGRPTLIEWLVQVSEICGACFGHREYACPCCAGLDGCDECGQRGLVLCILCAGGHLEPWAWL